MIALEERSLPDEYQLCIHWPATTIRHLSGELSSEGVRCREAKACFYYSRLNG